MDIKKHINSLNKDQLEHVIECIKVRKSEISSQGYVRLYGVSDGHVLNWYADETDAHSCFMDMAKSSLRDEYPEVSLVKKNVDLDDLAEYIGEANANLIIEQGTLVVKSKWGHEGVITK